MTTQKHHSVLWWAGQALAWVVILVAVFMVAVAVLIPRIAGATPYTILTSSMEPQYPPGTLVVVRGTPVDQIGVGSVITFQLESGRSTVVTHRVVKKSTAADGETVFTTQGDANDGPDPEPVLPVQVKGTVWYAVPKLGWVSNVMDGDQRNAAVYVVAGGLGVYALAMFGGTVRDRIRRRANPPPVSSTEDGS